MSEQYTKVAVFLHWLIGLSIIGMLVMGFLLEDIPDAYRFMAYQLHKSFGLSILVLSFVRLFWRLTHKVPALPDRMNKMERFVAHAVHGVLYVMMVVLPLSGWALVSASPRNIPTQWFGLFEWPHLPVLSSVENKKYVSHMLGEVHETMAAIMIVLLVAHVGAALKHHFINKDDVLTRMLPFFKAKQDNL